MGTLKSRFRYFFYENTLFSIHNHSIFAPGSDTAILEIARVNYLFISLERQTLKEMFSFIFSKV